MRQKIRIVLPSIQMHYFAGLMLVLSIVSTVPSKAFSACPDLVLNVASDPLKSSAERLKINIDGVRLAGEQGVNYSQTRYSPKSNFESKLEEVGKGFSVLIADPGLILRLKDFAAFVKTRGLQNSDPCLVRQAYADHLGTKKLYRALVLDQAEMETIMKEGMKSSVMRSNDPSNIDYRNYDSLNIMFHGRLMNFGNDSMLSLAERPEIALSAATPFLYKNKKPILFYDPKKEDKDIYLFEVEVPEIDILYPVYPEGSGSEVLFTRLVGQTLKVENLTQKKKFEFTYDRSVESVVLYQIGKEEIKGVTRHTDRWTYDFER